MALQQDLAAYDGPYPDIFSAFSPADRREILELIALIRKLPYGLTLSVGNLKGGVGKSTTSVYLALLLALAGETVLLVDADGTNLTVTKWSQTAALWPSSIRVVAWGARDNKQGTGLIGVMPAEMDERIAQAKGKFGHLVVDIGPQREAYLRRALKHTRDFIVLSGQYAADTDQIGEAVELATEVADDHGVEIYTTVLFTRVNKRAQSYQDAVDDLEKRGVTYFDDVIPTADHYGLATNNIPMQMGGYLGVMRQLVEAHLEMAGIDV